MIVENPIAFSFIMQDDIYLLNNEKALFVDGVSGGVSQHMLAEADMATPAVQPIVETATPLVIAEVATTQPVIETPVSFKYLGSYKKGLLIIVYYTETEFIAEKHLTALESILGRLGFSLDDAAILNRANYADAGFEQLAGFFKPQKMLLLGKQALPTAIEALSLNKPKPINNCNTLLSFSFDEMMDNTEYKKAFWEQMKQL